MTCKTSECVFFVVVFLVHFPDAFYYYSYSTNVNNTSLKSVSVLFIFVNNRDHSFVISSGTRAQTPFTLQQCAFILKCFFNSAAVPAHLKTWFIIWLFHPCMTGRRTTRKSDLTYFLFLWLGMGPSPPSLCFLDIVKEPCSWWKILKQPVRALHHTAGIMFMLLWLNSSVVPGCSSAHDKHISIFLCRQSFRLNMTNTQPTLTVKSLFLMSYSSFLSKAALEKLKHHWHLESKYKWSSTEAWSHFEWQRYATYAEGVTGFLMRNQTFHEQRREKLDH